LRGAQLTFWGGGCGRERPQRRVPEDGGFIAGCRLGEASPLSGSGLGLMSVGCFGDKANAKSDFRFGTPRLVNAEESAKNLQ
jgi:hypothetical protein